MFHAFNVDTQRPKAKPATAAASDSPTPKKRLKVSKACDRCRIFRVKCGEKPCSQCQASKVRCVTASESSEDQEFKLVDFATPRGDEAPPKNQHSTTSKSREPILPLATWGSPHESLTSNAPLKLEEYYGLDRPIYFFSKIDEFFAGYRPISTAAAAAAGNCEPFPNLPHPTTPAQSDQFGNDPLSTDQHAYFLRLFWEAYHPLLQVPIEADFRVMYDSLWQNTAQEGQPHGALIDCMTALGIQYGHGADLASRILGLRSTGHRLAGDVSWAGFAYFRRCRDSITSTIDVTIVGMQCYALMALYLLNASDFKAAYNMLGVAIRNAHGMNLHREPDERMVPDQKDIHRRVWWLLFVLDIRCSLQLRKPVAVQASVITCALPGNGGVDLAYLAHAVKLAVALANIDRTTSTFDMYAEASNIAVLEHRAATLSSALVQLERWRMELPSDLLSPRRESHSYSSQSMSTAESPLVLELGVPTWLHRQRILLEVHYHNAYIMLQRPFICFPRDVNVGRNHQPQTDQHARSALQHAIAMTIIIHGVCSNSDALMGWPEVLQPLWNATVTMFAFILANPLCGRASGARSSIGKALSVFEAFLRLVHLLPGRKRLPNP